MNKDHPSYCRICNSETIPVDTIDCAGRVKDFNKPFKIDIFPNTLYKCPSCTHLQMHPVLPDDYYDDNYNTDFVHFEKLAASKLKKLQVLSDYSPDNNSCLNIGCGEWNDLSIAASFFRELKGIEPALNYAKIASGKCKEVSVAHNVNASVINAYFGTTEASFENYFSAFYSLMVFEHLENPADLLKKAVLSLKNNGIGLINVPNGQIMHRQGLFSLFIAEHINYFTPLSLATMASNAGLEVLEINTNERENENLCEIVMYVKKSSQAEGFSKTNHTLCQKVNSLLKPYRKIIIWGAGNNAHGYSRLLDKNLHIKHVVDSSKSRTGQFIDNIDIPVEMVTSEKILSSDAVIIFASAFNAEIIRLLRNEYNFKNSIYYFNGGDIKEA